MLKVYLHIGLAKTGTTSVQRWFYGRRSGLSEQGMLYPDVFLHDGGAHHRLAHYAKKNDFDSIVKGLATVKRVALDKGIDRVLISSEELCTLDPPEIDLIARAFFQLDMDAAVIITIRPHFSLFRGSYFQQVREGYIKCSMQEFWLRAKRHAKFLKFSDMGSAWSKVTRDDKIIYVNAEPSLCEEGSSLANLKDILNVQEGNKEEGAGEFKYNESLSTAQVNALLQLPLKVPMLWSFPWDKRRFCYLVIQQNSEFFKRLSHCEDPGVMAVMSIVCADCAKIFIDDWKEIRKFSRSNIVPSCAEVNEWYQRNCNQLEHKVLQRRKEIDFDWVIDEAEKYTLQSAIDFYDSYDKIEQLGPSEQLHYFSLGRKLINW